MTNQDSPLSRGSSVWAYLRVSGPEQQERGTIVSQHEVVENWAHEQGLMITRWFVDEAKPASDVVKRDDFTDMICVSLCPTAPCADLATSPLSWPC